MKHFQKHRWLRCKSCLPQKTLDIGQAVLLIGTALFNAPYTGSRSPAE